MVELKTKTILPDIYHYRTLSQIAKEKGIPVSCIVDAISNSHAVEKSKWYKSRIAFNKREKESSFYYYGLGGRVE